VDSEHHYIPLIEAIKQYLDRLVLNSNKDVVVLPLKTVPLDSRTWQTKLVLNLTQWWLAQYREKLVDFIWRIFFIKIRPYPLYVL
jgi:hypothetical protein